MMVPGAERPGSSDAAHDSRTQRQTKLLSFALAMLVSLVWPEPAAAAGFDHVKGRTTAAPPAKPYPGKRF